MEKLIGVFEYITENDKSHLSIDDIAMFKTIDGASQYILDRINHYTSEHGKDNVAVKLPAVETELGFSIDILNESKEIVKTISFAYADDIPLYE